MVYYVDYEQNFTSPSDQHVVREDDKHSVQKDSKHAVKKKTKPTVRTDDIPLIAHVDNPDYVWDVSEEDAINDDGYLTYRDNNDDISEYQLTDEDADEDADEEADEEANKYNRDLDIVDASYTSSDACSATMWYQPGSRRFIPREFYGLDVDLLDIEVLSPDKVWTCLASPGSLVYGEHERAAFMDSLVIAVDGACHGIDTPSTQDAFGIYFGKKCSYNKYGKVGFNNSSSPRKADLIACKLALEDALNIQLYEFEGSLRRVIVKADSAYLIYAMTEWIFKWRWNNFTNSQGWTVTNANLLRDIDDLVLDLNRESVEVLFWLVPTGYNRQADYLADRALDYV